MRFYVVLGCLVSAALLGYVKRPSAYHVVNESTEEADLLLDVEPAPQLPTTADAAVDETAPRPSLLSLLTFSAALLGAVSTVAQGACATSACLTTNIVDTATTLHAASKRDEVSVPTAVSSTKVAATVTPGG